MKLLKSIITTSFTVLLLACNSKNDSETSQNTESHQEVINGITVKIYQNNNTTATNIKGILLMGSGNDENNPSTGSLDGILENKLCAKLAAENWICAIVAYRDQPPLNTTTWNDNARMLTTDFSNVANGIIAKYGGSRNKTVMGGVSYTSFVAMGESKLPDSPIKDFAGIIAACGGSSTWASAIYYLPVANIVCQGNNEGDVSGNSFNTDIKAKGLTQHIKDVSSGITDTTCNGHCGGQDSDIWLNFMYNNAKLFVN